MANVLCTGSNRTLMETRAYMLQEAGHDVVLATSEPELLDACKKSKFAVAVIGQGLSNEQKLRVGELVRNGCPGALILELYIPSVGKALPDADAWLETLSPRPESFVQRVNQLAALHFSTFRPSKRE